MKRMASKMKSLVNKLNVLIICIIFIVLELKSAQNSVIQVVFDGKIQNVNQNLFKKD